MTDQSHAASVSGRSFTPRCTCSWRGESTDDAGAARAQIESHLGDETDPNVGPNCVPWNEVLDA